MTWYVNVNDLIGGWIVANVNLPLGDIDCRPPERGGTMPDVRIIADCNSREDALRIAYLLNDDDRIITCDECGSGKHNGRAHREWGAWDPKGQR